MTIKDVIQQIDAVKVEEISNFILSIKTQKNNLSMTDKKLLCQEISNFRKSSSEKILKRIIIFSIWSPDEAIKVSRKKGVFRYKAWGFKKNYVEFLLYQLKKLSSILKYSSETCTYIEHKLQISWFFLFYKKTEEELIKYIDKHHRNRQCIKIGNIYYEEAFFKELLSYADVLFNSYLDKKRSNNLNKNKLEGYSSEDISESISYLIFLYDTTIGIKNNINYIVSPKYIQSEEIRKIILKGCKFNQLQQWELLVDYFNYKVKKNDNQYTIFDKELLFDKSITLGYIKRDIQEIAFHINGLKETENKVASMSDFCNYIKDRLGDKLISSVGTGKLSRYRFEFPMPLFEYFKKTEQPTGLFQEEVLVIENLAKELIMTPEDLLKKKITYNCSLLDIVLFQRFFIFINFISSELLFKKKDISRVVQSLIPAFEPKQLSKLLSIFIGDEIKANELIDLFTYKKDIKLDIQYTPLLKVSNNLIFPSSIISKSNILRNCIAYSYLLNNQIVNRDELESLVFECSKIFEESHPEYKVFTNKKFSYLKQKGEIDVLVISQSDIIIIECKSPISPVNNFEMRSSFDHINKAVKQLNHIKKAMTDNSFKKSFFKNLDVDDIPRNIHTCIVFGNRLFNGYTIGGHPIRYIRELDMILNDGHIYSSFGNWRVWKNNEYSHKDLIDFISYGYALGNANFKSMEKVEQFMSINSKKINYKTYRFNLKIAVDQYDKVFTIETKNEDLRKELESVKI